MTHEFDNFAARAAPAIFVLLWSTGFVATKYVVHNADPLTYLAIRMALVVGLAVAAVVALAGGRFCAARLGGLTGDTYGALAVCVETLV